MSSCWLLEPTLIGSSEHQICPCRFGEQRQERCCCPQKLPTDSQRHWHLRLHLRCARRLIEGGAPKRTSQDSWKPGASHALTSIFPMSWPTSDKQKSMCAQTCIESLAVQRTGRRTNLVPQLEVPQREGLRHCLGAQRRQLQLHSREGQGHAE